MNQIPQSANRRCISAIILFTALCIVVPLDAATTMTATAPTTAPTVATRPTIVNADLLAFLVAENAKTISKIRTQQYHADETVAMPPVSPERAMHADIVKEGASARWRMEIPLKDMKTGIISPVTFLVIHTKAGAMTWYEKTAEATMYEADENGAVPGQTMTYKIQTQQPVDVLQAVAAQGDGRLAKWITACSSPPRSIAAQRDVKNPNIFYITMFTPEFDGPRAQAVLDAGKGCLMTKMTIYATPRIGVEEIGVDLGQVGADRLWFPTSYEQNFYYDRKDPKLVTRFLTSRLSNIVLNEPLPSDAFNVSRLNFPDGLKVNVHPIAGKDRLLVWFKGALLDEDAYMAQIIAARKPANPNAPAIRPQAAQSQARPVAPPPAAVQSITGGRRWAAIALIGASLVGIGIAVIFIGSRRRSRNAK